MHRDCHIVAILITLVHIDKISLLTRMFYRIAMLYTMLCGATQCTVIYTRPNGNRPSKLEMSSDGPVTYRCYDGSAGSQDLDKIRQLIENDLSEPYSAFTYYYFLHQHPHLCRLALLEEEPVGVVMGKISDHRGARRGYIGMLAVNGQVRGKGIGR